MDKIINTLGGALYGFLTGGLAGWLAGVAWFYVIEVPYANRQLDFMHRAGYLCGAGNALAYLAIPGAFFGALAGICWATRNSATPPKNSSYGV